MRRAWRVALSDSCNMTIEFNEEQCNKLKNHAFNAYIDELVVHCNESYPYLEIKLGKEGLKTVLAAAVEKAKNDGFCCSVLY
ncbi:hypothetical protein HZS38_18885 [Xenorhabdus nematophila]|nr:hypothetical protein D3790_19650 [Xenorhabdus nematophila]CEE90521.1 hypothetical protein XNA1_1580009 [Xenorhabdus nematophila str. Anatoliense]CEF28697.1 hypothetical protein XNW1_1320021 [Xenorhabdus nematophila str. Websteri]KHD28010.1 hypothetical protein LH67_13700 [Xenorhabdus nematophila]MBA0021098.1 hypothetical protein [Xenorhabdus nematophila]